MKRLFSFMFLAMYAAQENAGAGSVQSKQSEATAEDTGEQKALEDQPTDNTSGSTVPGTTGATHKIGDMLNLGPALPAHIAAEQARRGSTLSEDWAAGREQQPTGEAPVVTSINEADIRQGQGNPPNKAAESLDQPVAGQPVTNSTENSGDKGADASKDAAAGKTATESKAGDSKTGTTNKK